MIGTLFLFCFWPSFNAGTAYGDGRLRAITNTYISISASVILTFVVSAMIGHGKNDIIHIQNATLAGGVAVGAVADKDIGLFGAMIVGSVAGTIATLGYKYLLELLKEIHILEKRFQEDQTSLDKDQLNKMKRKDELEKKLEELKD